MKKNISISLIVILTISACASTPPINTNCITVSGKKVQDKSYLPDKGTGVGVAGRVGFY